MLPAAMPSSSLRRFVPIIVLFITGAVLSLVLTPICWYMRFAKVAAFLVGVLWLNNALLMLLGAGESLGADPEVGLLRMPTASSSGPSCSCMHGGLCSTHSRLAKSSRCLRCTRWVFPAGLLNGVYVVSGDACLYAETFVMNFALRRVTSYPETHTIVSSPRWGHGMRTGWAALLVPRTVWCMAPA